MKRPLIGIIPLIDIERESYWMLPGYMKGIEEAGGIPVMLPLTSDREPEAMISLLLYIMQKNLKNAENAAYSGTKWKLFCCPWCWNRTSLYLGSAGACS